jgi:hypothetical protein
VKIGLVGAHCVGKSTLSMAISKRLKLPIIEEQMRCSQEQFAHIGYPTLDSIIDTLWYPHFVFDLILRQVKCECKVGESFVSDRTILDYYIYYCQLSTAPETEKEILRSYVFKHYYNVYDTIVYIPITFPMVGDDYRNTDSEFRDIMDKAIFESAKHHKDFFILSSKTVDDRVDEVLNYVSAKDMDLIQSK